MNTYHLIFTILIVFASCSSFQLGDEPVDRCQHHNQRVCIDCLTEGLCVEDGNGSYTVIVYASCLPGKHCDKSHSDVQCASYPIGNTVCDCSNQTCEIDPNSDSTIVHCETDGSTEFCAEGVDLSSCSCKGSSLPTILTEIVTTTTTSPITTLLTTKAITSNTEPITTTAKPTTIPQQPSTTLPTISPPQTTLPQTTTASALPITTSTPLTTANINMTTAEATTPFCPTCGFIADESDCKLFYFCAQGVNPYECADNFCFDQTTCRCQPVLTTLQTVMPVRQCPPCGYLDDENDCKKYYRCSEGLLTDGKCPAGNCFNPESCLCIPSVE